ncbi:hypothetical protein MN032_17025 [Agromyces atrinae]|uniref:hypothetical protein n=1 Tax=Agromyces atrinae TaxID=592376 RepID=UPI001F59D3B6|nr:hypothetical protein [Agromyces atrinae]MCI2959392.1 hypothetical protein [Agromyces atrinae]
MTQRSDTSTHGTTCTAHAGERCTMQRPGHLLGAMQARVAETTTGQWRDAIVVATDASGWSTLALLDGGTVDVWSHAGIGASVDEPVAVHLVYGVIAVGSARRSIAVA